DLQISSSSKSKCNSDNNLNDYVSMDNLKDNDILENDLENGNNNEFQEYPKTSETSVASIYNVSSWKPDDVKNAFEISNIQYAYGDPGTIRSIQKCSFLGVLVKKTYHSCLSVKVCEFGSATLNIAHTSVNFEDQLYKNISMQMNFWLIHLLLTYNTPCPYIDPITNIRCNRVPILRKYKH
ncbi:21295_t:CDS:2, partial [Gigaspora margarita]